jgi:hypothetical protein
MYHITHGAAHSHRESFVGVKDAVLSIFFFLPPNPARASLMIYSLISLFCRGVIDPLLRRDSKFSPAEATRIKTSLCEAGSNNTVRIVIQKIDSFAQPDFDVK